VFEIKCDDGELGRYGEWGEGGKHVRKTVTRRRIWYFTDELKQTRRMVEQKSREGWAANEKNEPYLRFIHPMEDVPDLGIRNSTLYQRPGRPSCRDDFFARQREAHQKVSNVTCAPCRK